MSIQIFNFDIKIKNLIRNKNEKGRWM